MRKKMFFTFCLALSLIILLSYCLIYFIFYSVLLVEIQTQQNNLAKYNETIFTSYIDSFNMVPYQLFNDEEIGNALNTDSPVYLDMFRAKELIKKKFYAYLSQQLFSSNIECRFILYLNTGIPLSSFYDTFSLSENVHFGTSQVYSSINIKNTDWYKKAVQKTWSPYFFYNQGTDELCYVKCIQNYNYKTTSVEGIGVIVIGVPIDAILEKLSLSSSFPGSSIILLNEDHEILYQQGNFQVNHVQQDWFLNNSEKNSIIAVEKNKYIFNTVSVDNNLFLVFITPLSDIINMIQKTLNIYILFSLCSFFLLISITYLISRKITAPLISFANLLSNIKDIRTFDVSSLTQYNDIELKMLGASFSALVQNEKTLIQKIVEENKAKRAAILQALQAQINPHFLYNALDIVNWMALSKNEDAIADAISSISNLMHYSISHPDATVPISLELDNIQEFIRIYMLEYPMQIEFSYPSQEELSSIPIEIPKFTLQPLVENSILHNPDLESLSINISILKYKNDIFLIEVTDNGSGSDPEKLNAFLNYQETELRVSNGFGIRNVNERLQLHYGEKSGLLYQKTTKGNLMAVIKIIVNSKKV